MRELQGVLFSHVSFDDRSLKRKALLFDKFVAIGLDHFLANLPSASSESYANIEFLRLRQILKSVDLTKAFEDWAAYRWAPGEMEFVTTNTMFAASTFGFDVIWHDPKNLMYDPDNPEEVARHRASTWGDLWARAVAAQLRLEEADAVALCENPLPASIVRSSSANEGNTIPNSTVLHVALDVLPVPGDDCSWQDILAFKAELNDKEWGFHRFLRTLATKQQTEAEIRDDIEWSLNEYTKAMKIHSLKAGNSFLEVYLIPAIEIIEDVAKLNWSKIAKGALSVKKRQVELSEAEMKAPGRECAYVFDARKNFGTN